MTPGDVLGIASGILRRRGYDIDEAEIDWKTNEVGTSTIISGAALARDRSSRKEYAFSMVWSPVTGVGGVSSLGAGLEVFFDEEGER